MTDVPEGGLRVEIDDPQSRSIEKPAGIIRGWFATRGADVPDEFRFQVGGIALPHRVVERVDVEAAMPGHAIVGFELRYDLSDFLPQIQSGRFGIRLSPAGYDSVMLRFKVEENALALCLASAGGV